MPVGKGSGVTFLAKNSELWPCCSLFRVLGPGTETLAPGTTGLSSRVGSVGPPCLQGVRKGSPYSSRTGLFPESIYVKSLLTGEPAAPRWLPQRLHSSLMQGVRPLTPAGSVRCSTPLLPERPTRVCSTVCDSCPAVTWGPPSRSCFTGFAVTLLGPSLPSLCVGRLARSTGRLIFNYSL